MSNTAQQTQHADTPKGLGLAITAYFLWGFLPLYMKAMAHIPAVEVVAHRVIWSVPVAGFLLILLGRTKDLRAALRNPRMLAMGCVTAGLISVNWGIYVWAIASGNALDAALGYYINPLFSVALGAILLGERLTRTQLIAVSLATFAVIILIAMAGQLPIAALGLTVTWGFYAFFKRSLPIGPNQGFLLEVLILSIPAVGYVLYLASNGAGHFAGSALDTLLLLGCGLVTSVPLLIYANAAKLVRLSTVGILQYIAPTMIFVNAIVFFGEEVDQARMIAFPIIWLALIVYTAPMIGQMRRARSQVGSQL